MNNKRGCGVSMSNVTCPLFLQKKLLTVLQRVLPIVFVHHTSCLCYGLCWTHMDANCTEGRFRLTEGKAA